MSSIKLLDSDLINKIAAGEVIERPVSVVKELVENALDSGATEIIIETENGGKSLIKVTDNGEGMTPEELEMAVKRHATSKINTQEDLFKISTLGFRGEALPSIASVSKMVLLSKHKDNEAAHGYLLTLDKGDPKEIAKTASNQGTTIKVKDLFYNIPARLKFLKKDQTELSHIQTLFRELCCRVRMSAIPTLMMEKLFLKQTGLIGNQETALKNVIGTVFGIKVAKSLCKLELELADISVTGFISSPTVLTNSRSGQVVFVNNRNIFSPIVNKGVDIAISDLVPRGRHPYLVLFIDMDYDQVDVNVHTAKREVRFASPGQVIDVVKSAIKNGYAQIERQEISEFSSLVKTAPSFERIKPAFSPGRLDFKSDMQSVVAIADLEPISFDRGFAKKLTVLGQAYKMFIILLDGEELLLVDQHAAHERILYEEIKEHYGKKTNVQILLIPENVELGTQSLAKSEEHREILADLGFEWDKFSETSIVLRAVPSLSTKHSMTEVFKNIIDELEETEGSAAIDKIREKIFATIACKAAIKAGDVLDFAEMQQLIKDLFKTPNYQTCPHGRPVITVLTKEELSKRFLR